MLSVVRYFEHVKHVLGIVGPLFRFPSRLIIRARDIPFDTMAMGIRADLRLAISTCRPLVPAAAAGADQDFSWH